MSSALNNAETQWLAQLSAMRAAIAELKLPQTDNEPAYGQDVWTDEEDSSEPTSGDDDLWDLVDDDEEEDYASLSDSSFPVQDNSPAPTYGQSWLRERLGYVSSGLSVEELQDHVGAILGSDSSGTSPWMPLHGNVTDVYQMTSFRCFSLTRWASTNWTSSLILSLIATRL